MGDACILLDQIAQYVRRDLKYIDRFLAEEKKLSPRQTERLAVIRKVYEQQKYMYDNRTHTVADRIVSISQPYIRPIVRGKAKTPTEFGAKRDLSIDHRGMARIEKQSFDTYNESDVLIGAAENPGSVPADIPSGFWRIKYTGTGRICHSAKSTASGYQGRRWADPKKIRQ